MSRRFLPLKPRRPPQRVHGNKAACCCSLDKIKTKATRPESPARENKELIRRRSRSPFATRASKFILSCPIASSTLSDLVVEDLLIAGLIQETLPTIFLLRFLFPSSRNELAERFIIGYKSWDHLKGVGCPVSYTQHHHSHCECHIAFKCSKFTLFQSKTATASA